MTLLSMECVIAARHEKKRKGHDFSVVNDRYVLN